MSLSHKGRVINPFKSPVSLPLVLEAGRWGQVSPTGFSWLQPVSLSDLSAPHPPPTAERNEVKQHLLASGLGCGEGAGCCSGLLSLMRCSLGMACHKDTGQMLWLALSSRKQKPPDTPWPNLYHVRCVLMIWGNVLARESFCCRP